MISNFFIFSLIVTLLGYNSNIIKLTVVQKKQMFSHLGAFIWLPLNFKSEKFAKTIFFVEKNNR
jgi:hypothetical protein